MSLKSGLGGTTLPSDLNERVPMRNCHLCNRVCDGEVFERFGVLCGGCQSLYREHGILLLSDDVIEIEEGPF